MNPNGAMHMPGEGWPAAAGGASQPLLQGLHIGVQAGMGHTATHALTGHDHMHYRSTAMGMPAIPPPPVPPVAIATNGIVTVPLVLEKRGAGYAFPNAYSLALSGRLSAGEFASIVEELNETVRERMPALGCGAMALMLIPCTSLGAVMYVKGKIQDLPNSLQQTCAALNKHYQGRINLRVTVPTGYCYAQIRVDMEVM